VSHAGAITLPPPGPGVLIWEDADLRASGEDQWWLARAHQETASGVRDFFIAEDTITGYAVGVVLPRDNGRFKVIAAVPMADALHLADAVSIIKDQVSGWLTAPQESATRGFVARWRRRRSWIIARDNAPLAIGAFFVGGFLGFAVAMFALSSGLIGWPMVLVGFMIGGAAGWFLKLLADRKPPEGKALALAGSWGRFAVVTTAAMLGTIMGSGGVLTMFWT